MPKFQTGNMWDVWDDADLFLITTNSFIRKNSQLTMGRGMAFDAALRDKQMALYFGRELKKADMHLKVYGLFIPSLWPHRREGAFQTKLHWQDRADTDIIIESTRQLFVWAETHNGDSPKNIHLNFPGIGYGGLDRKKVLPIVEILPNNVTIWEKE